MNVSIYVSNACKMLVHWMYNINLLVLCVWSRNLITNNGGKMLWSCTILACMRLNSFFSLYNFQYHVRFVFKNDWGRNNEYENVKVSNLFFLFFLLKWTERTYSCLLFTTFIFLLLWLFVVFNLKWGPLYFVEFSL